MIKLTCDKARWYEDGDGFWLAVRTKERRAAAEFAASITDKPWDVEGKPRREKRSLSANAYCWKLLDELAATLDTTKDKLYLRYIKHIGVYRDYHLMPEEAKSFETAWSMLGTGWPTERVDFTPDGEQVVVRAYYGSSRYNTKQMARLIRLIVEDCKEQGIETKTPQELAGMVEEWGRG